MISLSVVAYVPCLCWYRDVEFTIVHLCLCVGGVWVRNVRWACIDGIAANAALKAHLTGDSGIITEATILFDGINVTSVCLLYLLCWFFICGGYCGSIDLVLFSMKLL